MTTLETVLTAQEMNALITEGVYAISPWHIGGHGYVTLAIATVHPHPPRYEFDPARRVWKLIPVPNPIPCPRCQGAGAAIEPDPITALPARRRCSHCHGLGKIPGGPQ